MRIGEPELRLIPVLADPNRQGLDIGANIGVYTAAMLKTCRGVVAFEPHPTIRARLRKAHSDADILPFAASRTTAMSSLRIPFVRGEEWHPRSSLEAVDAEFDHREIEVGVVPIDALPLGDVGLIKIDVEGHELAVLEGAQETIRRDQPNLLIESEWRHGAGPDAVADFLKPLGYDGFFVEGRDLVEIGQMNSSKQWVPEITASSRAMRRDRIRQLIGGIDSLDVNSPINNFIFVPEARAASMLDQMRAAL